MVRKAGKKMRANTKTFKLVDAVEEDDEMPTIYIAEISDGTWHMFNRELECIYSYEDRAEAIDDYKGYVSYGGGTLYKVQKLNVQPRFTFPQR